MKLFLHYLYGGVWAYVTYRLALYQHSVYGTDIMGFLFIVISAELYLVSVRQDSILESLKKHEQTIINEIRKDKNSV